MNASGSNKVSYSKPDEESLTRTPIVGTPYWCIGVKKNNQWEYRLTLGKEYLSEVYKTEQEVLQYLENNMYDVMLKTIMVVVKRYVDDAANAANTEMQNYRTLTKTNNNNKNKRK